MNLDRYVGYELELYTDLNVGECVKRLRADFKTPRVRIPRETVSDRTLAGRITGCDFTLELNKKRITELVQGKESLYRERTLSASLIGQGNGTRIRGRYGYGIGALFADILLLVSALVIGIGIVLFGVGAGLQGEPVGFLAAIIGAVCVGAAVAFLKDQGDEEMKQERDYIAGYLQTLLEARGRVNGQEIK